MIGDSTMPEQREPREQLLTVPEAADYFRVHRKTLYDWCRKGVVPHVRIGPGYGRIRLRRTDLRAAVTSADQRRSN